jgi:hypothetical protein
MPAELPGNEYKAGPIVPLDAKKHAGLGIDRRGLRRFTSANNSFAITLPEFFYAARHYPLVFVKSGDGEMGASVITGLRPKQNLFVDARGDWLEQTYVPASVRRFPFHAVNSSAGPRRDKKLILVDESGLCASTEAFFDSSGLATARWKESETFIADYIAAQQRTADFCACLGELDLLEPFDAQVNPRRQDSLRVTGMHRVNEERLNRLPAKTIRGLMQRGDMSRIYAHLISLENFAKLLDLSAAAE